MDRNKDALFNISFNGRLKGTWFADFPQDSKVFAVVELFLLFKKNA